MLFCLFLCSLSCIFFVFVVVVVDFAGEYSVGQKSEDFRYWHQCDNYDIFDNLLDFFIQFLRLA